MGKTLQEHLKEFQSKHGKSDAEMSQILGISERMYAYYETGEYKGKPKKIQTYLQKLADYDAGKLSGSSPPCGARLRELEIEINGLRRENKLLNDMVEMLKNQSANTRPVEPVHELKGKKQHSTARK
jgi:transcriptional regulator with XRE-family HTH domain